MADQAAYVKSQATAPRGPQGLVSLSIDCMKLADLQLQLLEADVKESWQGTRRSIVYLGVSVAMLLAALPVAMFGGAEYLRQAMSMSLEFALLLISGVVIALSTVILLWSVRELSSALKPMARSAEEMRANLTWIREILHEKNTP